MPNVYRLDKPSGEYPEGSPLHGSTYATVYLNSPQYRPGSLIAHPDGTFTAKSEFLMTEQDGFETEAAAVEWMLRQMLESGQGIANDAIIALAKL